MNEKFVLPTRHMCTRQLLVDDLLVYSSTLPPVPTHAQGILPTIRPPMKPYVIPLSDPDFSSRDSGSGQSLAETGREIQFTNNHQVLGSPTKPNQHSANQGMYHAQSCDNCMTEATYCSLAC